MLGSTGANLFHLRQGEVIRLTVYFEPENALAEVGFSPLTDSPG